MSHENSSVKLEIIMPDEQTQWTHAELCRACAVHSDRIVELVEVGILEPQGREPDHWLFAGQSLPRARIAFRLQRDLEIDLNGIALALELLDQIDVLRMRLGYSAAIPQ